MVKTYCDICGNETDVKKQLITINSALNTRTLDVCQGCTSKLEWARIQAEIDFFESSKYWQERKNDNGDYNYGKFVQVGTCEQGGMRCPKCGHSNNSYTFTGTCESCGYREEK